MSKDHEQFLLECELVKSMLMRVWAKGLITDEEMKKSMERIVEKLKDEENKKEHQKIVFESLMGHQLS